MIGSDENGELYKGIVCFMIIGLKESTLYMIKSSPEITINAAWFSDECFDVLYQCEFNVRTIACDDHQCLLVMITSIMYQRLRNYWRDATNIQTIYVWFINAKIYTSFLCIVHLIKDFRNNLLICKRFIFPSFSFHRFRDIIDLQFGDISWKILHNVFERNETLDRNFKKALKLTSKVNFAELLFWKPIHK